ncbi:MAG: ABC transporter ATP-binding protein [Rectinemataceae bacterium]
MMRLMRYLKPYLASIALIVALLFLQANADLALPDYMARIVNTGIQQGGIEDSLPRAIGGKELEKALLFTSQEESASILAVYDRFEPGSEAHQALLKKYPNAGSEPLYILKKIDATTRSRLNALMLGAISSRMTGIQAVKGEYERLGMDTATLQTSYILSMGGLMLLLTLLSVVATVIVGFLGARTAAGFARDLRLNLFRKVENFSFAEFDKFSTASLITRSTNDITQMQMVTVMGLRMFFYAPIIGIGGVIRATGKASSMWWIIALAVSIILGVIAVVFTIALPKFKNIQKFIDKLNLIVRENLSGMMVIRAFAMQGEEEKRFDKANKDLTGTMLFVTRVMVILMPLMMLIMNLVSLLIIWTGAHEVALSQIRVGDMMAFMQYAMQIFFAFIMLSMMFIILPRASVSADRIAEVLATEPSIVDPKAPCVFEADFSGTIEFKDVSFRYPGATEDVLSKINFTAKPGQTTAIIGTTGSGKSTLVSLIPRFYDATEGSISVGGIDIREVSQHDLRSKIGFVPQKASLFSGTIESNLLYAEENASREDMALALEVSQAKEFVDAKQKGIGLEISQGGINVSGGQRQRLTIARAIVKKAPIYIFDDSFSALDFKTDTLLRQALKASLSQSTILLVTQRVAAIKQADQILVLDEGRLVGRGTHHELMETCEVYRDIAMSQLKQEELA